MTEWCVDASVGVKWVIEEPLHEEALALPHDSLSAGVTLVVPHLFNVEVDSVIRKLAFQGVLSPEQERQA